MKKDVSQSSSELSDSLSARVGESSVGSKNGLCWILEYLELDNFKSYKGNTRIGPLRPFMAVIGPNGSGKSNIMDAISFVMGERAASLRVRRLNELIHGSSVGQPSSTTASVAAIFRRANYNDAYDGPYELKFSRVIRGTSCEFFFNSKAVSKLQYFEELENIGINVKAKNFLVYQGAVESIALKSSKERTALIEEICGSVAFKEEYEARKKELGEIERKIQQAHLTKKSILNERKEAKMELHQAQQFNELMEQVAVKEREIQLFKLYHLEQDMLMSETVLISKNGDLEKLTKVKDNLEKEVKDKKKARGELTRQLNSKEAAFRKAEKDKMKMQPKFTEVQGKQQHLKKKLENVNKSLKQAKDNKSNQEQEFLQMQKNLEEAQELEKLFLEQWSEKLSSQDVDITLRESQMQDYLKLKKEAMDKTKKERKAMEELEQKRNDAAAVYNSAHQLKLELEGKEDLISHEIKETEKFVQKLREKIAGWEEQLQAKEGEAQPLRASVTKAAEQIQTLQTELEEITKEVETGRLNKYEANRLRKKQEVIDTLKRVFPGVYERIKNLCKPVHAKYKLAVTKIMGKNMNAIVVDTEATARECVQYLKEQMIDTELFLPMDLLEVKPLRTRLREQPNVRLAFDILQFNREVEKAILHCTKSIVICETEEDADKASTGEMFGEKVDAVSLAGSYYSTSGMISGGQADLQRKVQRWDETALTEKEARKDEIRKELRDAMKESRKKIDLDFIQQEIDGIKKRLQLTNHNLKTALKSTLNDGSQPTLQKELDEVNNRCNTADSLRAELAQQLKKAQKAVHSIEDKIFEKFCRQIGISNIRAYEERDVREFDDLRRQKEEFQTKIQEIQFQIDYEQEGQKTLDNNIKRWETTVAKITEECRAFEKEVENVKNEISKFDVRLGEIQGEIDELKKSISAQAKETSQKTRHLSAAEKGVFTLTKEVSHVRNKVFRKKVERHEIFKHCKLTGVEIPFTNGTLDDINFGVDASSLSSKSISSAEQTDSEIQFMKTYAVSQRTIETEDRMVIIFQDLPDRLKTVSENKIAKTCEELEQQRNELEKDAGRIHAPNLKADQKWQSLNEKAREHEAEFLECSKRSKATRAAFENAKKVRHERFMTCYEKITENIDNIYKALTRNQSAQALLALENPEEPYLDGVSYNCVAPGKRFQTMNNLSGGEKTIAALALLIAIQSYEPAPFFVLDEIDAALDNTNVSKVINFIKAKTNDIQIIVISLKEEFYAHADALVGIAADPREEDCICSQMYSLDLNEYSEIGA